jgi:hypothetical protein
MTSNSKNGTALTLAQHIAGTDRLVRVVLDAILDVTGVDPASIPPDYRLGTDLYLTAPDIQRLCGIIAVKLGFDEAFLHADSIGDWSVRELTTHLRRLTPVPTKISA